MFLFSGFPDEIHDEINQPDIKFLFNEFVKVQNILKARWKILDWTTCLSLFMKDSVLITTWHWMCFCLLEGNREGYPNDFVQQVCTSVHVQKGLKPETTFEEDIARNTWPLTGNVVQSAFCSVEFKFQPEVSFSPIGIIHKDTDLPFTKAFLCSIIFKSKMTILGSLWATEHFFVTEEQWLSTNTVSDTFSGSDKETCLHTGSTQNWYNFPPMVSHRGQKLQVGKLCSESRNLQPLFLPLIALGSMFAWLFETGLSALWEC